MPACPYPNPNSPHTYCNDDSYKPSRINRKKNKRGVATKLLTLLVILECIRALIRSSLEEFFLFFVGFPRSPENAFPLIKLEFRPRGSGGGAGGRERKMLFEFLIQKLARRNAPLVYYRGFGNLIPVIMSLVQMILRGGAEFYDARGKYLRYDGENCDGATNSWGNVIRNRFAAHYVRQYRLIIELKTLWVRKVVLSKRMGTVRMG